MRFTLELVSAIATSEWSGRALACTYVVVVFLSAREDCAVDVSRTLSRACDASGWQRHCHNSNNVSGNTRNYKHRTDQCETHSEKCVGAPPLECGMRRNESRRHLGVCGGCAAVRCSRTRLATRAVREGSIAGAAQRSKLVPQRPVALNRPFVLFKSSSTHVADFPVQCRMILQWRLCATAAGQREGGTHKRSRARSLLAWTSETLHSCDRGVCHNALDDGRSQSG